MRLLAILVVVFASTADARSVYPPLRFEALRVAGETQIVPDEPAYSTIAKAGKRIFGTFKICIDTKGNVARIDTTRSTGYPAYDQKLRGVMRTWKYRAHVVNGKPATLCGAVTFLYTPLPKPITT